MTFHERRLTIFHRLCEEQGWPIPENPNILTVSYQIWTECGIQALGEMLEGVTSDGVSSLRGR